jgi:GMP synthase-like glutamine amidotransferase
MGYGMQFPANRLGGSLKLWGKRGYGLIEVWVKRGLTVVYSI